jgi:hypothetical protein
MPNTNRLFSFAVSAGAVCGVMLILITMTSRNGLLMYVPYIALGIICTIFLRTHPIDSFATRFGVAFTAYVLATVIIEIYIIAFVDSRVLRPLTVRNFAGPLAAMMLIGAVGSAVIALLAQVTASRRLASTFERH